MQSSSAFQFEGPEGTTLPSAIEDEDGYMDLISNVISAASTAVIPSKGTYDMSGLFSALPEVDDEETELSLRFRSHGRQERDMRIGALGELYVG
jgi:hypothetical protein